MPILNNMHIKPRYYVNKFKFKFLYVPILINVINQGSIPYYFKIFFYYSCYHSKYFFWQ